MSLRHQIVALTIVPLILAILAITAFITWQSAQLATSSIETFEQSMLKSKEGEILNLTKLAVSTINDIYQNASADDEVAKEKVKAILAALDYGQDGYFFVYDYDGNNIVHPRQGFRAGRNWLDLVDPDGDKVIASLIDTAKAGGGLHQYKWQRPSTGQIADKLSFVVALDKWHWVLGTGVYLDEVYARTAAANADLRANIRKTFIVVASIAIPAVLIVFAAGMMLTLHERRLADGKLKQLTQRVIDAQEEERTRLARELHDGISQNLVGVRYAMDLASRKIGDGPEAAGAAIGRSIEALNVAIKEVRRLSHDLRPRVLDDLGLRPALDALCQHFAERAGVAVHFEAATFVDDLKPGASTALYRVAQEALNNAERHSGATDVTITLWTRNKRARMTVADNGRGFEGSRTDRGGLGLRNMQERIAHLKGVLLVKTSPQGTTLTALLPRSAALPAPREARAA